MVETSCPGLVAGAYGASYGVLIKALVPNLSQELGSLLEPFVQLLDEL